MCIKLLKINPVSSYYLRILFTARVDHKNIFNVEGLNIRKNF